MKKTILIDFDKCTGCMMCTMACSLAKTESFNPARSRIGIINWEKDGLIVPIMCQHCEEPVCMFSCPTDAMSKDGNNGLVRIDRQTCINCKICRQVCPYGGPSLDPITREVVLCDHCEGKPACVDVCPCDVLKYVEMDDNNIPIRLRGMTEIRKSVISIGEPEKSPLLSNSASSKKAAKVRY